MTRNLIITARRTIDTIAHLEGLSRQRHLTDAETDQLEKAIYRLDRNTRHKSSIRPWTPQDDAVLVQMYKALQPLSVIGVTLKRSRKSIYARIWRIRLAGEISIADRRAFSNRQRSNSEQVLEKVEG